MATTNTPYPVATIIDIGKVSQGLALVDNLKQKSFKNGAIDNRLPLLIFLVRRTVEYGYEVDPLGDTTTSLANYLYALCRRYANLALNKLGQGGGGIIIDPGSGQPINLRWVNMSFTVGSAGSPVNDGELQFVINLTNILSDSATFGFSNASPFPRTGTVSADQQTYTPTYTQANMTITLAQAVHDGEQYTLDFGRSTAGSTFNPPSVVIPTPYLEGQYLTNDGTELLWDNPMISITSANFEIDGKTYINTALAIHTFRAFCDQINRFFTDIELTSILSGGFTINAAWFDANNNEYTIKIFTTGA